MPLQLLIRLKVLLYRCDGSEVGRSLERRTSSRDLELAPYRSRHGTSVSLLENGRQGLLILRMVLRCDISIRLGDGCEPHLILMQAGTVGPIGVCMRVSGLSRPQGR